MEKLNVWQQDYADRWLKIQEGDGRIEPVTELYPQCRVMDAYRIQKYAVEKLVERGRRVIGYKVGLTNGPAQLRFGIAQNMRGCFLDGMQLESGAAIAHETLNNPLLEVEIAYTMARDVTGALQTLDDVLDSVSGACLAYEVVSGHLKTPAATAADLVADNAAAKAFVTGRGIRDRAVIASLADSEIQLFRAGGLLQSVYGREICGNPLLSVLWLANALLAEGGMLRAGDIVMAGSATAGVPIQPGDEFRAVSRETGEVTVAFPGQAAE